MADARLRSDQPRSRGKKPALSQAPHEDDAPDDDAAARASDSADEDLRTRRDAGPDKTDRAMEDRAASENREITEEERVEMFASQFLQSALPDLPKIPGYHVIWLTTTNPRDSIPMRMRLGYVPIKPSDIPGWDLATIKTGEYAGYIGVNEMLAFKLPERLYQRYMQEAHYHAPNREQEKLTAMTDAIREQAREVGADVIEGDGIRELRKRKPPLPTFPT